MTLPMTYAKCIFHDYITVKIYGIFMETKRKRLGLQRVLRHTDCKSARVGMRQITNFKVTIFIFLFFLLSNGCKKEYEYTSAYIYETKFVHWGKGYFKLKVFYEFEYNDSIYKGADKTEGLYKIYGRKRYREGDKIMIKYPKGKPEKSEVTRYVFRKKTAKWGSVQ